MFAADCYFHNSTKRPERENMAHYFPYDVKLRLLAHSRSFLATQKARNAIVGAENLLKPVKLDPNCTADSLIFYIYYNQLQSGFSLTFEVEGHWLVSRQAPCET